MTTSSEDELPRWAKLVVALGIFLIWASSCVVQMRSKTYTTPFPIHLLAGGSGTYLLGKEFGRALRNRIAP